VVYSFGRYVVGGLLAAVAVIAVPAQAGAAGRPAASHVEHADPVPGVACDLCAGKPVVPPGFITLPIWIVLPENTCSCGTSDRPTCPVGADGTPVCETGEQTPPCDVGAASDIPPCAVARKG
jgi:hypothetical protein